MPPGPYYLLSQQENGSTLRASIDIAMPPQFNTQVATHNVTDER